MSLRVLFVAAAVGISISASWAAYASKTELVVKATSKDDMIATSAAVHKEMVPGGRYEFVTAEERSAVDAKLGDMQSLFDKYGAVASMGQDSKLKLFNDQEAVNAILTNRDGDRRICKSEAPTGSLIPKTSCRTYGDIQRTQRDNQRYLQESMQTGHPLDTSHPGH